MEASDAALDHAGMLALDPFNPVFHVYPLYVHVLGFNGVAPPVYGVVPQAEESLASTLESPEGGAAVIAWINTPAVLPNRRGAGNAPTPILAAHITAPTLDAAGGVSIGGRRSHGLSLFPTLA